MSDGSIERAGKAHRAVCREHAQGIWGRMSVVERRELWADLDGPYFATAAMALVLAYKPKLGSGSATDIAGALLKIARGEGPAP